ncbi:carbohydrate binding domain-containing protein [Candidatus Calescamantes bacterium]|nr:carbohydrate binding domain-containing protein [Candidatus Calescamantes bacterium]
MKSHLIALGLVLSLLMIGQIVRGGEPQNILENAGFEDIKPYTVPEKWRGKIEATEVPKEWGINTTYPGKLTVIYDAITSHGGSKYIKLEKDKPRKTVALMGVGKNWMIPVSSGKKYLIKIWAKGEKKEKGSLTILAYGYSKKAFLKALSSEEMKVSPEWKEYKFEFTPFEGMVSTTIAFHVKGIVYLDDAYFAPLPTE